MAYFSTHVSFVVFLLSRFTETFFADLSGSGERAPWTCEQPWGKVGSQDALVGFPQGPKVQAVSFHPLFAESSCHFVKNLSYRPGWCGSED